MPKISDFSLPITLTNANDDGKCFELRRHRKTGNVIAKNLYTQQSFTRNPSHTAYAVIGEDYVNGDTWRFFEGTAGLTTLFEAAERGMPLEKVLKQIDKTRNDDEALVIWEQAVREHQASLIDAALREALQTDTEEAPSAPKKSPGLTL